MFSKFFKNIEESLSSVNKNIENFNVKVEGFNKNMEKRITKMKVLQELNLSVHREECILKNSLEFAIKKVEEKSKFNALDENSKKIFIESSKELERLMAEQNFEPIKNNFEKYEAPNFHISTTEIQDQELVSLINNDVEKIKKEREIRFKNILQLLENDENLVPFFIDAIENLYNSKDIFSEFMALTKRDLRSSLK